VTILDPRETFEQLPALASRLDLGQLPIEKRRVALVAVMRVPTLVRLRRGEASVGGMGRF